MKKKMLFLSLIIISLSSLHAKKPIVERVRIQSIENAEEKLFVCLDENNRVIGSYPYSEKDHTVTFQVGDHEEVQKIIVRGTCPLVGVALGFKIKNFPLDVSVAEEILFEKKGNRDDEPKKCCVVQ